MKFTATYQAYTLALAAQNLTASYISMHTRTRDMFVRRLGDLPMDEITADTVRRFLLWLQSKDETPGVPAPPTGKGGGPISGSFLDIQYRNLKAFFNWCEDEELINRSPMRRVARPKITRNLPDALSEDEVTTLLGGVQRAGDGMSYRDYVIILMFLDTGVRLAELAGLTVEDVNLEHGYARVMGKGRVERLVPLGITLRRDLSKYMLKYRHAPPVERALFVNMAGDRLQAQGIQTMIDRHFRRWVPRHINRSGPHTLRHTFATFNLRYTGNLKVTSLIMGHTTTRTTENAYLHLTGNDILRNAEGSPMDKIIRR